MADHDHSPSGSQKGTESEVERLVYKGYKIPNPIRLAWTLIVIFSIYYLVAFSWPDLKHWLGLMADGGH